MDDEPNQGPQAEQGREEGRGLSADQLAHTVIGLGQSLLEINRDQHAARLREVRSKNFRSWVFLCAFVVIPLLYLAFSWNALHKFMATGKDENYVAVVRVDGQIGPSKPANASAINHALVRAFHDKHAKGIILRINSPGGSPVQAALVHDELIRLTREYPTRKIVVVGDDIMTSAAYMIATGVKTIYVNPSTITGSIGVILENFNYSKAMARIGISRYVQTAGINKDRIDPYTPIKSRNTAKIKKILADMHKHFIDLVLQTRAGKLKGNRKELFSGDFWTGDEALKLGLVDGLGDFAGVMRRQFGVHRYKDYTAPPSFFARLRSMVTGEVRDLIVGESSPRFESTF